MIRLFSNSMQKIQWAHMSISTSPSVELGSSKDCHLLKYYNVQKWGSRLTLRLDTIENTHYIQNASNKSCWALNSVQKSQRAHICLSPPGVVLGAPKIAIFWNIIMFKNGKVRVDSLWGWTLPKIRIVSKNASNEESHTCWVF